MKRLLIILLVIPMSIDAQDFNIEEDNNQNSSALEAVKETKEDISMIEQGKHDAKSYYDCSNCGKNVTGFFSVMSPIVGVIPALFYSSSPPQEHNLNYPYPTKITDENYNLAYKQQAYKMKRRKVWRNFSIFSAINITAIILAVSWNN